MTAQPRRRVTSRRDGPASVRAAVARRIVENEGALFAVVSLAGWFVDFAIFVTLVNAAGVNPFVANYISSVCGATLAFTFYCIRSSRAGYMPTGSQIATYVVYQVFSIAAFSALLSALWGLKVLDLLLGALVLPLAAAPLAAKVIVTPINFLTNYICTRTVLRFMDPRAKKETLMSMAASDIGSDANPVAARDVRSATAHAVPRLMVFIPAYRCAAQVKRVIAQFAAIGESLPCLDRVVVVDNQSPDGTIDSAAGAFRQLEGPYKKIILRNCDNYGLGGSHKAAFRYATEEGMDYLLVLHGDDQATFEDIVPALRSGEAFKYDCYLGSRFERDARRQGYSALRTFGNVVYNWLFTIVAGKRITDLGSGLNLYRVSAVDASAIDKFPDNLTFNYVMLLWSLRKRQNVRFFPISWREEDQRSNVKLLQQAVRVLGLLASRWLNPGAFFAAEHRTSPKDSYRSDIVFEG